MRPLTRVAKALNFDHGGVFLFDFQHSNKSAIRMQIGQDVR